MEEMFDVFRLEQRVYVPCKDNPTYHPGRTAEIYISGKKVGVIGELHPEVVENYGMKSRIYAGEIDIEELFAIGRGRLSVARLPKFPSIGRDMAVVVEKNIPAVELLNVIKANGTELLQDAQIFDVYHGEQIASGKKSVAFNLTFQAADRTLTDNEVNEIYDNILKQLAAKYDAHLRA